MAAEATRTLRPEDEISHYRIVGPLLSTEWLLSVKSGHQPVQVTQFSTSWMPDSRRLVVCAGKRSVDAVLIRSFR